MAEGAISLAREAARPVVVDPKEVDVGKYRGATVVTPNLYETRQIVQVPLEDEPGCSQADAVSKGWQRDQGTICAPNGLREGGVPSRMGLWR